MKEFCLEATNAWINIFMIFAMFHKWSDSLLVRAKEPHIITCKT